MKSLKQREPKTDAALSLRSPSRQARPNRGDFLLGLQRTAGNAAVASWIAGLQPTVQAKTGVKTAAKPKAKAKSKPKPKPPTLQVTVDEKGMVHTNDAAATLIGFTDSAGTLYVEKKTDKASGTFYQTDDTQVALTKLHKVAVILTGADGTAVVSFTANTVYALLTDAEAGLIVDTNGRPMALTAMPASLAKKMLSDVRLELADGSVWVLMTFPGGTLEWVAPNHSKSEYAKSEAAITAESANLPDTKDTDFANVLKMVSVVSVIEGSFGSTSGKGDDTASLGIFQWGMKKNQSADAGSLGVFFATLKSRATAAKAKTAKDQTDEDTLYINAWKQCTDAGLEVTSSKGKTQLTLKGKVATGKDVESTMKGTMAKDDLRTYQLIAALDWIDEMKAKIVMPGYFGGRYVGNGYHPHGDKTITVKGPVWTVELTMPEPHLTVGDICTSEQALAVIADLLPNRPNYVQTAVWRAGTPSNTDTQITALLAAIDTAQPAPPAPAAAGKKKKKAKPAPPPTLTEATVVDKKSFATIRELLWPSVAPDDQTLISQFEAAAIELYKSEKKQKGASSYKNRARRLATAHVVDWSP
jgi:hypothetical protein